MGLQIWLPLINDTHNQGIMDINPIQSGGTWDTNGKVGECYNSGGSGYIYWDKTMTLSDGFTFAFWVNVKAFTVWGKIFSFWSDNVNFLDCCMNGESSSPKLGFNIYEGSGSTRTKICDKYTIPISYNNWYHVAFVVDGLTVTHYLNGTVVGTDTCTKTINKSYIQGVLCAEFSNKSSKINSAINDFRYYDTPLSAREIELISRGLVAHWPLSMPGNENLVKNSRAEYSSTSADTSAYSNTRYVDIPIGDISETDTFTVSCEYEVTGNTKEGAYIYDQLNGAATTIMEGQSRVYMTGEPVERGRYVFTYHPTAAQAAYTSENRVRFRLRNADDGAVFKIWNVKLEYGDKATPWVPNPADDDYTTMGFDDDVEYDVSGYGYNGTKINPTNISYTSETPRYNACTHFSTRNSKIKFTGLTTTGFANSYTFAWWGKSDSYSSRMHWGFGNGIRLNGIFNGNLWNTGDIDNNPLYTPGTTTQVSVPSENVWHHFAMVGDGSTCKVYMDGVLWGQAKTYKSISGTTIYINGWNDGTSYSLDDLSISDFRIYATALSADQILDLYKTSASLSQNGTLLTNEITET